MPPDRVRRRPTASTAWSSMTEAGRQVRLFEGGLHHYLTPIAESAADGGDAGIVCKGHVHDAALIGRHGLQSNRAARGGDALGHALGHVGQRLVTPPLVTGDVDEYSDPLAQLAACDETHQELESPQRLAAAADQKPRVVSVDVENGAANVLLVGAPEVYNNRNLHRRDEVLQYFGGYPHHVRWRVQDGYAHPGRLTAKAQNPRLATANDVYFHVRAIDVELL